MFSKFYIIACGLFFGTVWAQNDTLKVVQPQLPKLTAQALNPLAPAKAAFYSAILPGLGQYYNKSYWKIPLVYG